MWQRIKKWWNNRRELRTFRLIQQLQASESKLYPECLWVVCFDQEQITCTDADGRTVSLYWNALDRVMIITNDTGPLDCDFYWCLFTDQNKPTLMIPEGATGLEPLRDRLMALPGFDHEKMIEASCSVENARFLCWEKQGI